MIKNKKKRRNPNNDSNQKKKLKLESDELHDEPIHLLSLCYPRFSSRNLNHLYEAHFGKNTTELFLKSRRKPSNILNSFASAGLYISKPENSNIQHYTSKLYWNGSVNAFFKIRLAEIVSDII
eukprot:264183_1